MSNATPFLVDPPYGEFVVGRGVGINGQVLESSNGGAEAGKDISAARWIVRIRGYTSATASTCFYDSGALSKVSGTSGYYSDLLAAWTSAMIGTSLLFEEILEDTSVTDANTKSGKGERILRRWVQDITDAPIA